MLPIFYNSREHIAEVLRTIEPDAVERRRGNRFRRRVYYAAGVADMYCIDQHDKFQRFGLRFHNAIDPFNGYNHWLKCWWTNKNPILINSFYLQAARKMKDATCGGMPVLCFDLQQNVILRAGFSRLHPLDLHE